MKSAHVLGGLWCLFSALTSFAETDGKALFAQHCAVCHQADGSGTAGFAPPLTGDHWNRLGTDRNYLPSVILKGLSGKIIINNQILTGSMPNFSEQLDDAAIAAIATHVRQIQGVKDDKPYVVAEVKALRAKAGNPSQTRQRRAALLGN
jgi:mono/diheme cytochrome c family protein